MRTGRSLLLVVVAIGLTGCSTEAPPPRAAAAVVSAIAGRLATTRPGVVFTAATDPDHLLGGPGGCTSKAAFTDTRITTAGADADGIQAGGVVEVFADASGAAVRQQRIRQLEKDPPLLGSEYTFVDGAALLRVSGRLTSAQAAEYADALKGTRAPS